MSGNDRGEGPVTVVNNTHSVKRIVKLEESVVNRIAAGEIIQRPANALKELLENSIDAKATAIEILVQDGGLKLLQITDNGSGIHLEDMPILCERFTTSKLKTFSDLNSIATYGFRGEALASITHIARVTVTTKTDATQCAYRAQYMDGHLTAVKPGGSTDPKPVAGRQGTQITVEDMFYSIPSRRRALNKPNEEYARIIDVLNKYAIHSEGIAFTCKRQGDKVLSVSTASKNSAIDNIRSVYGNSIANELLACEVEDTNLKFKARGLITNANYHVKKMNFILFINKSSNIKKALETIYSNFLPKGSHSFVYLALSIDPARIDVNVHPTKREVNILNEEEIIACLAGAIQSRLTETDNSRVYYKQAVLSGAPIEAGISSEKIKRSINMNGPQNPTTFVRTDSKQQKIVSMLDPSFKGQKKLDLEEATPETLTGKARVTIRLASVKELRAEVRDAIHEDLTAIFTEHVFVGVADLHDRYCVIQHLTKLYLVDYGAVSAELFYQIGLSEFGNFGTIELTPALPLRDLLRVALESLGDKQDSASSMSSEEKEENVSAIYQTLCSKKDMLQEYFSLEISDTGELRALPLLLKGYTPALGKLPNFLLRLGRYVTWDKEKECFKTFLRELSLFYIPEVYRPVTPVFDHEAMSDVPHNVARLRSGSTSDPKEVKLRETIETLLFQAFKKRLIATKDLATEKRVTQIGELSQLYKVFERC